MTIDKKMMAIVGLVLLCMVLAYSTFTNWSNKNQLSDDNKKLAQQQMQAQLDLGKAQTSLVNTQQEAAQLKQVADQAIQNWMKDNNANATDIGVLQGQLNAIVSGSGGKIQVITVPGKDVTTVVHDGATGTVMPPAVEVPSVSIDKLGKYVWLDTNGDGIPDTKTSKIVLNYKDYRIDISVDALANVFNYSLHQNFKAEFVRAITKAGAVVQFVNIHEVDDKGNVVNDMKITDFKVTTLDQTGGTRHVYWWDPKLDLGFNVSMNNRLGGSTGPEVGLSASGYGKTKDDNEMRFFRMAVGKNNNKIAVNVSPFCYNAGKHIPLFTNLLLCLPTIGYSNGNTIYGITIANPF